MITEQTHIARSRNTNILTDNGISFVVLSNGKYQVGNFSFCPATGNFLNFVTRKPGRGVFNLLNLLRTEKQVAHTVFQ